MSMPPAQCAYTCPYCRMASEGGNSTCPHCGAPADVRRRVSDSGWVEQPPIRDMARIRFSRSTCQISGTYVPVADMGLHDDDWVYFSHHVLLHTDPRVRLDNLPMRGGWKRTRQLLETADPIDKWIQVDGHSVQVIGVMDPPAASLPGQKDLRVLLPYFTMRKMFPSLKEHML